LNRQVAKEWIADPVPHAVLEATNNLGALAVHRRRTGRAPLVYDSDQSRANAANCLEIGPSFHAKTGSTNVRFRPSTSHASSGDPIS
jgi:hypothetical protein